MRWIPRWLALVLLAGCAGAPTQELSDARVALESARAAGAEVSAPSSLGRAQARLDEAVKRLRSGDYPGSRSAALEAREGAIGAREAASAIGAARAALGPDAAPAARELLLRAERAERDGWPRRAAALATEAARFSSRRPE